MGFLIQSLDHRQLADLSPHRDAFMPFRPFHEYQKVRLSQQARRRSKSPTAVRKCPSFRALPILRIVKAGGPRRRQRWLEREPETADERQRLMVQAVAGVPRNSEGSNWLRVRSRRIGPDHCEPGKRAASMGGSLQNQQPPGVSLPYAAISIPAVLLSRRPAEPSNPRSGNKGRLRTSKRIP